MEPSKQQEGHIAYERKQSGKRKRPFGESLQAAYSSVEFDPLIGTGHPRSPHRLFKESYGVTFRKVATDQTVATVESPPFNLRQVVHHHVNGLCIVTAGTKLPDKSTIAAIEYVATKATPCSAAEKRKRQAKMLKGGKVEDAVTPTTVLANLQLKSGDQLPIYSCVWGTILEINSGLSIEMLLDDPLLDGYLAVILPSGEFPPKKDAIRQREDNESAQDRAPAPEQKNTKKEHQFPEETAV